MRRFLVDGLRVLLWLSVWYGLTMSVAQTAARGWLPGNWPILLGASALLTVLTLACGPPIDWAVRRARKRLGVVEASEPNTDGALERLWDRLHLGKLVLWACWAAQSFAIYMIFAMSAGSSRAGTLGNLGAIRSALSIHYGNNGGRYPFELGLLTAGDMYMLEIPRAHLWPHHRTSNKVRYGAGPDDAGGWAYNNVQGDANEGAVMINCTHTDLKGTVWSSY